MNSTNLENSTESSLLQNRLLSDAITAPDLRIGNIVTLGDKSPWKELHGVPLRVTSIAEGLDLERKFTFVIGLEKFIGEIHPVNNQWSQFIEYVQPIELREDWLIALGCEKYVHPPGYNMNDEIDEKCNEFSINKLTIMDWGDGFVMSNAFSFNNRVELKSVHKFQNLVYALSGQDAEVNAGIR